MKTDQVFKAPMGKSTDFKFDAQVADQFHLLLNYWGNIARQLFNYSVFEEEKYAWIITPQEFGLE